MELSIPKLYAILAVCLNTPPGTANVVFERDCWMKSIHFTYLSLYWCTLRVLMSVFLIHKTHIGTSWNQIDLRPHISLEANLCWTCPLPIWDLGPNVRLWGALLNVHNLPRRWQQAQDWEQKRAELNEIVVLESIDGQGSNLWRKQIAFEPLPNLTPIYWSWRMGWAAA